MTMDENKEIEIRIDKQAFQNTLCRLVSGWLRICELIATDYYLKFSGSGYFMGIYCQSKGRSITSSSSACLSIN